MIQNAFGGQLLTAMFTTAAFPAFATPHLWLWHTTAPTSAETNEREVSASGYARVPLVAQFSSVSILSIANTLQVAFSAAGASWGNIVAWTVSNALSGGSYCFGYTVATRAVGTGDTARFAPGAIAFQVA